MDIGNFIPDNLIAGDFPLKPKGITAKLESDFNRGDVVQIENGVCKIAEDAEKITGIITDNINKFDDEEITFTIYIKGEFSKNHLNFGTVDIDEAQQYMNKIGLITR